MRLQLGQSGQVGSWRRSQEKMLSAADYVILTARRDLKIRRRVPALGPGD